jgi:hypothetical protein
MQDVDPEGNDVLGMIISLGVDGKPAPKTIAPILDKLSWGLCKPFKPYFERVAGLLIGFRPN